uniref:DUF148 domain-containing protein n=1 Tax=Rhabditophanes sp. KR3021 TaxID=114890 RepID=A0AC35U7Q8_9BILA
MQFRFVILSITLVASTLAFPMSEGDEEKGMFGGHGNRIGFEFMKNLSEAARNGLKTIHQNKDQTRAEEETAVADLFAGTTVTDDDKTAYNNIKTLAAAKETEFTNAIDSAVAASTLTETQKALYAACKTIFQNKSLTFKQAKEDLKSTAEAADKLNAGDSKAVEELIKETIRTQIKADKSETTSA